MRRDKRVYVIGEDVGVYGGAFKVTLGFQEEFGPWRVIDAPLSETAIVGSCTGAALMGMRPVAEMQFADFVSCAWDHLVTIAAKQFYRAGTPVPIVVRLPSGGGFSGGPFHSQNPESSFAHIPGLKCVCPATPEDAKGLLASAIEDPNPVLYFEHKHLYRRIKADVPEERYTVPIGKARTHREGEDISLITWGAMVYTAGEAADQLAKDDVSVEIVDLRSVLPWDREAVLASVRKTSKVLVLHEDTRTGGFGAEIAATIAEEAFEALDAPVKRIAAPDAPVPFSPPLEKGTSRRSRRSWPDSRSWRRTDGDRDRDRRRHAADGRLRVGGDGHEVVAQRGRGDRGRRALLEISTDKVDTEVPSPGSGIVQKILVQEGETVDVGTTLAVIAPEGAPTAAEETSAPEPEPAVEAETPPEPATAEAVAKPRRCRARSCPRRLPPRPVLPQRRTSAATARRSSRPSSRESQPSTASTSDPFRHRPGRPRDQEGHPRVHRARRAGAPAQPAEQPEPRPAAEPQLRPPEHRSRQRREASRSSR